MAIKKPGDSNPMDESTLALALVIPDYRPDMLSLLQRPGQFILSLGQNA